MKHDSNSVTYILRYNITYYRKGSIIYDFDEHSFYFPNHEKSFDSAFYNGENQLFFDSCFKSLGKGEKNDHHLEEIEYFIVMEDVVCFQKFNSISFMDNGYDDSTEFDSDYLHLLFDDIKYRKDFTSISIIGTSSISVSCVVQEHFQQGMDDWDSSLQYIGLVDNYFDPINIVTEKSRKRIKDIEEENKRLQELMYDSYMLDM